MGALYGASIDTTSATFARLDDDQRVLAQWIEITLQTKRGQYWSAPDHGCDLREYVLAGLTEARLAAIPGDVRDALELDERIESVDVTATQTYLGGGVAALKLDIAVTPKSGGPFQLTATATADVVTVILRGL